jgi:sugar phosphate isomerase/epimerase
VKLDLKLGINLGFAVNKYAEPHIWTRIVGEELGLKYVQFVADLLNPFLPDEVIREQVELINENTSKYGIEISSTFLSSYTRVNHFMHPDPKQKKVWFEWFKKFADISVQLGAKSIGGHLGILTFHDYLDPVRRHAVVEEGIKLWKALSWYCKDIGLQNMIFEPMSIPREFANTVQEKKELLQRLNDGSGIPFKLCLDIGHSPHPDERDPYRWITELGVVSPIIHIQQTESGHSRHWPFTDEYNQSGIIQAERVLSAIEQSGLSEAELIFEIYHREAWSTDFRIIEDHKQSVNYWRKYVTQ